MRDLVLLRGLPGSGKSYFIAQNNLEPYSISSDNIRLLKSSPTLTPEGKMTISQRKNDSVFELIRNFLEERMVQGDLTVVDATHTGKNPFEMYYNLVKKYRYTVNVVDFSNIPLEVCLKRNKEREEFRFVPEEIIRKMHQNLQEVPIPSDFIEHTPETFKEALTSIIQPKELNQYSTIHHIGDIQGVFDPLVEYFRQFPYSETDFYIFTGDLVDRGNQNHLVVEFIEEFLRKPNAILVEGNHDTKLWKWSIGENVDTFEFAERTKPQIENHNISKHDIKNMFLTKVVPYFYYAYYGREVLVTHGGLSKIPKNLNRLSVRECIKGSGEYHEVDVVDANFEAISQPNQFSIHGHRNPNNLSIQPYNRVFNLEGKIEFGEELRAVQISAQNIIPISIPSTYYHESDPLHDIQM